MVTKYGMTDELGPICYGQSNNEVFIGRDMGHVKDYSEETAAKIDELVLKIVKGAYAKAEKILSSKMDKLHETAAYLMKHEKMSGEDFEAVMNGTFVEVPEAEDTSEDDSENKSEE